MDTEEAKAEFFGECDEILQGVSSDLRIIEKGVPESNVVDALYRNMHTLKGSAYLFGLNEIGDVAHAMETVLEPLRRNPKAVTPDFLDSLYRTIDLIEKIIDARRNGKDSSFRAEIDLLLPRLIEIASYEFSGSAEPIRDDVPPREVPSELEIELRAAQDKIVRIQPESKVAAQASAPAPASSPAPSKIKEVPKNSEKKSMHLVTPENSGSNIQKIEPDNSGSPAAVAAGGPDQTIRVPVDLLDKLMNLVGELVLVRNQVLQYASGTEDLEFVNMSQSLDVVTSDLQGEVMKTRMQPIGSVLNKFHRVIRDISRDLGKNIELVLEGVETELDKTLLEAIKDPLTHIVRNSCDHGLEDAATRIASGKDETGTLTIRSFHEGGQVVVEIQDDGKGLNREKIVEKAIEKGLVSADAAENISDREAYAMIFNPGFSTAEKVSAVSGRGVGLDVVKTNIEKIGGTVDIQSSPGKGTITQLKIPLTLAIVPAMVVRIGNEKFAIPQVKLVELVRVENTEGSSSKIELLQGNPIFRLRGDLLPLVSLGDVLKTNDSGKKFYEQETVNIVVLKAEGEQFGLIVDEILDTADIVVKPLSQFLKMLNTFSGATIMGDGSVALILDVAGIAQQADLNIEAKETKKAGEGAKNTLCREDSDFLFFELGTTSKYGIPLCLVHRLEEFKKSVIEYSGEQRVVRYRDTILPIISLASFLGFENIESEADLKEQEKLRNAGVEEAVPVIVVQKRGRNFGIEVKAIIDVSSVTVEIDDSVRDHVGILGNVIHEDEVVVVVDVLGVVESEIQRMISTGTDSSDSEDILDVTASPKVTGRILFAEDTVFFQRHVKKVLIDAGYQVDAFDNAAIAYNQLKKSAPNHYDLVLSDIEMPQMNGFEFARAIRGSGEAWFKSIPLVAITTRFKQRDIEEGKEAGFNVYMEKLDSDKLLSGVRQQLEK